MELTEGKLSKTCCFVIKCCNSYGTLPFYWNSGLNRLQLKKEQWKLALYRKWIIFSCSATFLVFTQILLTWQEASMFVKSFSLEYMSAFVMAFPSCYVNTRFPGEIVALLNALIRFEEQSKNHASILATLQNRRLRRLTKWIVKMTALSTFSMIPFQLNAIVQPCFPVYFGFWLADACKNGGHLGPIKVKGLVPPVKEFMLRGGICILSFANWAFLVPAVMVQICLMMLKAHCIRCYIRHITKELLGVNVETPRAEIDCLWLKLREIQVMLTCFRRIYSRYVLVCIAAGGVFAQVATLYLSIDLVRRGQVQQQKGMMIACTWVAIGMGLIFCFVYGTLGDVYKVAREHLGRIKSHQKLMKNKWFRKSFKAYPLLRISFGEYNFLEPSTPLNIENLVVEQTIDLLLV